MVLQDPSRGATKNGTVELSEEARAALESSSHGIRTMQLTGSTAVSMLFPRPVHSCTVKKRSWLADPQSRTPGGLKQNVQLTGCKFHHTEHRVIPTGSLISRSTEKCSSARYHGIIVCNSGDAPCELPLRRAGGIRRSHRHRASSSGVATAIFGRSRNHIQ